MTDAVILTNSDNYINVERSNDSAAVVVQSTSTVLQLGNNGSVVTVDNTVYINQEVSGHSSIVVSGSQGPAGPAGASAEEDIMYSKRVDFVTDNLLYKGESSVGSSENSPVWRVRKVVIGVDGDVTETWASGTASFDKVWADRASLIYS